MIQENIKKLRECLGLSQAKFADRIGVSRDVVANLEYGRLSNLDTKLPLLRLIAKEFGVPLEWILHGDGRPPLTDPTEAELEAQRMGELIGSDDPVVRTFLEFWSKRSRAEREFLSQKLVEFVEELKKNQK